MIKKTTVIRLHDVEKIPGLLVENIISIQELKENRLYNVFWIKPDLGELK